MTASGQFLGTYPVKALEVWNALPEAERRPGAVTIGERGPVDKRTAQPTPPPGSLIVRLFYRQLAHGPGDELRQARQADYPFGNGRVNLDAQPNYLWLTEAEWISLIPARPAKGEKIRVADAITHRLYSQYLHPVLAFCACSGWGKEGRRGGELHLIVEDVSADGLRLRLE